MSLRKENEIYQERRISNASVRKTGNNNAGHMHAMHKRGILDSTLVKLILVVVFIGLLIFITYQIIKVIDTGSKKQMCILSGVLESQTKTAGIRSYEYDCEIVKTDIKEKDVSRPVKSDRILETIYSRENPKYWDKVQAFEGKDAVQFRLNQKIAKDLKDCWEKTGEGEFDLFSEWWIPMGFEDDGGLLDSTRLGKWINDNSWSGPPRQCVICSRITFEKDFLEGKDSGAALNEYLKNTPHPNPEKKSSTTGKRISLYEFLLDDVHMGVFSPDWKYKTDESYAAVYVRINKLKGMAWITTVLDYLPGIDMKDEQTDIDSLMLLPYAKVKDECMLIGNYGTSLTG